MTDRIYICETCQDETGKTLGPALAEFVRAARVEGIEVVLSPCLNLCDEPVSLALRAPNKMAYLFSGIVESDARDVVALARLYAEARGGVIEDARPAGRLRYCLKGRIPAG